MMATLFDFGINILSKMYKHIINMNWYIILYPRLKPQTLDNKSYKLNGFLKQFYN